MVNKDIQKWTSTRNKQSTDSPRMSV